MSNEQISKTFFVAYSSSPPQVQTTIESAVDALKKRQRVEIETWRQVPTPGRFLVDGVLEKIDRSDFLVADITELNFNVTFEIGYALGKNKQILLVQNRALSPPSKEISQLGIFDTLTYNDYENASELLAIIEAVPSISATQFPSYEIDRGAPIYVLDTLHKTDASIRILSKIKKSGIRFRSYDPNEQPRLSAMEAYRGTSKSLAVVVNLLPERATDYYFNNLRGAFLGGLAFGFQRNVLILQEGDGPVPVDYRDFVSTYKHPSDVDDFINDLVPKVAEALQDESPNRQQVLRGLLPTLDLGDPAAENEATKLGEYYVETDEFHKVLSGSVRLAVGRKGSGKTALFFQVRDNLRADKRNIVLDLKPEGHQLKRFRHLVIEHLSEAVQEHVVTAFWDYILLLEIAYKILEKDRQVHLRDHNLYAPYQRLLSLYEAGQVGGGDADFSERMLRLVNRLVSEFEKKPIESDNAYLTTDEVTQMVFKHDIPELRDCLVEYLQYKNGVTILFDNIDKGWPTRGIEATDIIILRGLLEASRKLEKMFQAENIPLAFTVFLRNDVYELLVEDTPDRGKESRVSLDWTDVELLKEVLRRRLIFNGVKDDESFDSAWNQIALSHRKGVHSAEYLVEHSLLRPRNFLRLVSYSKSNAVNLGHERITEDDFDKAVATFSADLVNEIGLEIRDVFPSAEDILYYFIGCKSRLNGNELVQILDNTPLIKSEYDAVIEAMLWFSFLGIVKVDARNERDVFIYDVYYDMKKLRHLNGPSGRSSTVYAIHKAFWPFLEIAD